MKADEAEVADFDQTEGRLDDTVGARPLIDKNEESSVSDAAS